MKFDNNQQAFLTLLQAGLWEKEIRLSQLGKIDYAEVQRMAEEQSVIGLVAAGLEHVSDQKVSQLWAIQFAGQTIQLEQRNKAMNSFITKLIENLRNENIYTLLVKGQGVARCYERPLWRACGDIDLLLTPNIFDKVTSVFDKYSSNTTRETSKNIERKHREYHIDGWTVELHGTMHTNLSRNLDRWIDKVQEDMFCGGNVRLWKNGEAQVFLPRADEDVVFVFTHILQHLFLEGIGLRQICDWCRLLFCFHDKIDLELLEHRIRRMGLMTEWKAFGSLAVQYLGMSKETMPFYDSRFKVKGARLLDFIIEVGNFGHNRDVDWLNPIKRRWTLIRHRITDTIRLSFVFPRDAPVFLFNYVWNGVRRVVKKRRE